MFAFMLFVAVMLTLLFLAIRVPTFLKRHGQTVPAPARKRRRGYRYPPNDPLYEYLHAQALEDAQLWD